MACISASRALALAMALAEPWLEVRKLTEESDNTETPISRSMTIMSKVATNANPLLPGLWLFVGIMGFPLRCCLMDAVTITMYIPYLLRVGFLVYLSQKS